MTNAGLLRGAIPVLLSALMGLPAAFAQPASPAPPSANPPPGPSFNVRDFGAKGDGRSDDTGAIQAAMDAAGKKTVSEQPPNSAYYISMPVVFFPAGKYVLTDTIQIKANVQGEGSAVLVQQKGDKDILSTDWAWRWQCSGVTLVGGRHQLHIGNHNIDTGRIVIDRCAFYNCSGVAVHVRKGSNSTHISVRDCVFLNCDQAMINYCDKATVIDCWVSTSPHMKNKAAFENYGILHLEKICGVPAVTKDHDQRWVDNYGGVTCRDVRFGGEGAGFTPVVNFAPYDYTYPVWPSFVILDSCDVYALGNPARAAAVFCEQIPNQIVIRNCRGFPDLPAVRVSDKLDLATCLDNAEKRRNCLRFVIDDDNVELSDANRSLPEPMRPYQANRVVADAAPTTGHWHRGQMVWNRNADGQWTPHGFVKTATPADQEPIGWYCVESGKPGAWREVRANFAQPAAK
ncbi:MAG: Pectate lyase superfamily protein [Planctomycetes bacterium ADurb.Bin126]|nr:MAG: Pectate lyase superfamily protein [Planctomycetes bacterium ADurb.Bin126]